MAVIGYYLRSSFSRYLFVLSLFNPNHVDRAYPFCSIPLAIPSLSLSLKKHKNK